MLREREREGEQRKFSIVPIKNKSKHEFIVWWFKKSKPVYFHFNIDHYQIKIKTVDIRKKPNNKKAKIFFIFSIYEYKIFKKHTQTHIFVFNALYIDKEHIFMCRLF